MILMQPLDPHGTPTVREGIPPARVTTLYHFRRSAFRHAHANGLEFRFRPGSPSVLSRECRGTLAGPQDHRSQSHQAD
jgi:hypothetical protein